LFLFVSVKRN